VDTSKFDDLGLDDDEVSTAHNGAIDILRQVLSERKAAVEVNPELVRTDLLTQSGVYYETRPRLIAAGINPSKAGKRFRPNLVRKIELICDEMGVTREEIGIIAQARTFLYFRGGKYSVGYRNLEELMHKGTDLILIEKEGMAEVLRPFADAAGIAVLNSIGFVARYADTLAKAAEESGANVAMLTDFDVSGLSMTRDLSWIYRIGIDFGTLAYFGLTEAEVEEEYDTTKPTKNTKKSAYNHWKGLQNMGPAEDEDEESFEDDLEYLRTKRIELDSVVRKVGNQRFWQYVVDKLIDEFPTRNYNRAIKVPDYVFPDELHELASLLQEIITEELKDEVRKNKEELSHVEKIYEDVEQVEYDIKDEFKEFITMNAATGPALKKIEKLTDTLKKSRNK